MIDRNEHYNASDALTESLLVLESEFNELEQEYRGDLQEKKHP